MKKALLVMRHEFWRHVTRRSFLFAVFGMPALFVLIIGGLILFFAGRGDDPVGLVDQADVLISPAAYQGLLGDNENSVPFQLYGDETAAHSALLDKEIQAYVVIPPEYVATGHVTLYHQGDAYEGLDGDLSGYLRASLLAGSDPAVADRFRNRPAITFVSLAEESGRDSPLAFIVPFLLGFIFLIAIFSTSGFLIQAIVDEKENRTMEILITSLSPWQLILGKIVGLVSVGLVQIIVWLGFALVGFFIARASIAGLPPLEIPRSTLLIAVIWFVPFYVMIAALMTAVGISVTAVSEAQQAVGIVSILAMFPLYFTFLILESPDSSLSVTLSLIPFSAPLTLLTRAQVTDVPAWQFILSWIILVATALLGLFLVSRLLHVGMLRYGQKVTLRETLALLRWKRSAV